jgi:hypothetical protein
MAGVLGRAFVQVFADLSKFSPGLREKIKTALDEQTKGMKFEELDKASEKAGESAADEVARGVDRKIENNMEKEGKKGGSSFSRGLSAAMGGIAAAFMPALIAFGVEAAAALAPAAVALAATIPAAVGTAVGAMAVLKMATNGVGAALKDAFDPKKAKQFDEAMKKLSPSARSFVNEIRSLHPAFQKLQQDIQQTFFVQLQGVLTRVAKTLLPTLRTGLHQLSADLGQMGRSLLQALGGGRQDLAGIFESAHRALAPFIPLVGQLLATFLKVGAAAGPMFASLSGGFADLLGRFVAFINASAASGGLAKFFSDALVILHQLGGILGNVFALITSILGALQDTGGQGLGILGSLVGMLATFFRSAEGHTALVAIFTLLNTALSTLLQVITPLLPAVGQLATLLANGLAAALVKLTPYLVDITTLLGKHPALLGAAAAAWVAYKAALAAVALYEGIVDALNPVTWIVLAIAAIAAGAYLIYKNWDVVKRALLSAWDAVKSFFQGIWGWIVGVGHDIGTWFSVTLPAFFAAIPGKIWAALSALPALLGNLFLDALHAAGMAIGIGIGLILAFFIKMPEWIWDAVKAIGHLFVDLWHLALATGKAVLDAGVAAVLFVFTVLPGKIANFINRLPGIIGGAFKSAWDWARREVRDGADAVVGFVQTLPRRISGFMRNVGGDILSGLRSGINAVISGFNTGINKVGSFIHIGLPNIPLLASGGLVNAPTLAVVGEAGPEAVVPMSDPSKAAAVARKTGLLDILGSHANAMGNVLVKVYLGTREITDILDVRIDKKLGDQANELAYGTR